MRDMTVSDFKKLHEERFRQVDELAKQSAERQARQDKMLEQALDILETGDPRGFILDTFKTQHIGDNETAEGILIGTANQSIANSKGIQSAVYGESGTGKSHAARAMLHLFPERYYLIESLSDKALFYMDADELSAGVTIFSDDAKISEGIENIIKRSTAFFQEETTHRVSVKEGGKWVAKQRTVPPRINWLLTSVDSQGSEQLVNRQIGFGVDESTSQDDKVTAFELEKASEGRPEFTITEEVLICREIILNIKEDETGAQRLFTVKIPFAYRIEWLDKKNRRNLPIFLDMVKGYAVLNFKQRERDDEGAVIATEDDFKAAERLYNTRGGFQKLHIHEREKEMLQHIAANGGELATDELMNKLRLSGTRIRQIAMRLETVLPDFYVEKRSENVRDASDDSKSVITQHNYYCYNGAVTVDLFGSVVSLKPYSPDDDHLNSTQIADKYHLNNHLNPRKVVPEYAQNSGLTKKQANHNNIINNNNYNREPLEGNQEEDTCISSLRKGSSASDESQNEGANNAILPLDAADTTEPVLQGEVQVPFSGVKVVEQRELTQYFFNIFREVKSARVGLTILYDQDTLLKVTSKRIQVAHPELRDYDVYAFGKHLVKEDKQAEALLADISTPAVAAYDDNADS